MINFQEQFNEIKRGTEEILNENDLLNKLKKSAHSGKPLKIKAGFDPTAPDLHLGHTVLIQKMAQFQKFGHEIIFLIGDFTALVGDPSGVSRTRPSLSKDEVLKNCETYKEQVFKILDPNKTTILFNSEWLGNLNSFKFVELASHASVARMLEREDFRNRFREGKSIGVHEFLYPLLQAYDSMHLIADIELGGTDQKFNILLGRELMRDFGLEPQICITLPILEGLDGVKKMSKSLGNYIGVTDSPQDMFGKIMSIPDTLLRKYYDLLSFKSLTEINLIFDDIKSTKLNPKTAKELLAEEIVARFHSKTDATKAREDFNHFFSQHEIPENLLEYFYKSNTDTVWLPKLLLDLKFVSSSSQARRLISEGAIRIDSMQHKDEYLKVKDKTEFILRCGKRRIARIKVEFPHI